VSGAQAALSRHPPLVSRWTSGEPGSRAVLALGGYVAGVGLVSFLGWAADLPRLTSWDGSGVSIQPNTTIAAIAAGVAMMLASAGRRRASAAAGAAAGAIGLATLFQHATGVDLGIDTLLMFDRPWGRVATVAPGRMGLPSSLSWTLIGAGAILQRGDTRLRRAAAACGVLVTAIAALALIGHLFGADVLYSLPRLTAIAFQTSTILFAAGLALVAALPDRQPMRGLIEDSAAGLLIRRTLPFVLVLPVLLGWLRIAGQEAGLYDTAMGTALLVLALMGVLCAVLWWGAAAVARHEREVIASAALRARAELVLREVRDHFLVLDDELRYVFVNDAVCAATGLAREALLGQNIFDVFPDLRATEFETIARRVAARREAETVENRYGPWDRWSENRIYPAPGGGVAVLSLDLTERKRAERTIVETAAERERLLGVAEAARAEAERANRAKDDFLAVLSHELRSPLNAMLGWVRILQRAAGEDAMVMRAIETLDRNIWAQAQVIDDLLDVSRIDSGKLDLDRTRVDLAAVVSGAVESMRPQAAAKRLALELALAGERLEVDGDAARLQQIVGNLLHNAIKFTPAGGRISVRLARRGDAVELEVGDSGPGIEADLLPRIFDRFVQADSSTTRRHGGLGLGLSIVRTLAALHGGAVRAESEGAGRGARFTVTLPLAAPAIGRESRPAATLRAEDLSAVDVLLVEDDADSREALGIALAESGAQVRHAGSVREALAAYEARPPDVLVSDIGMPDQDGYLLIREIRSREDGGSRRTAAIAMTGFASHHDREAALRAGFDDHVAKPVEIGVLLARLRAAAAR
jgi:PAS domain S-box-containing protein